VRLRIDDGHPAPGPVLGREAAHQRVPTLDGVRVGLGARLAAGLLVAGPPGGAHHGDGRDIVVSAQESQVDVAHSGAPFSGSGLPPRSSHLDPPLLRAGAPILW
jgi:hypothetical protein